MRSTVARIANQTLSLNLSLRSASSSSFLAAKPGFLEEHRHFVEDAIANVAAKRAHLAEALDFFRPLHVLQRRGSRQICALGGFLAAICTGYVSGKSLATAAIGSHSVRG